MPLQSIDLRARCLAGVSAVRADGLYFTAVPASPVAEQRTSPACRDRSGTGGFDECRPDREETEPLTCAAQNQPRSP